MFLSSKFIEFYLGLLLQTEYIKYIERIFVVMILTKDSDIFGSMYHKVDEREPTPTAAAMLRDALNVWGQHSHSR